MRREKDPSQAILSKERFGRTALEELSGAARLRRLAELSEILTREIASAESHSAFFGHSPSVIESLRAIGHDLWSWEYDGDSFELWGGDYSNPSEAGKLQIEFLFPGKVRASWDQGDEPDAI